MRSARPTTTRYGIEGTRCCLFVIGGDGDYTNISLFFAIDTFGVGKERGRIVQIDCASLLLKSPSCVEYLDLSVSTPCLFEM